MMKYTAAEVKSGLLVFTALLLFLGITFVVGHFRTGETKEWKLRFAYVSGLEEKAPVHYAGREAGKVEKIEVLSHDERPILVTISLDAGIVLREDSKAYIDMLGLLGEKFVELSPGSAAAYLKAGSVIEGVDPVPMHEMMRKMNMLADEMEVMMKEFNPFLKETASFLGGHKEEAAKIITNLHETSANLRDMTNDLKHRPWRLVRKD